MERSRQIRYFLYSQYFADGVRITLEIIIPALAFSLVGDFTTGLTLSLGALCVSSADGPGPIIHRRNGMVFCNIFVFSSALLTGIFNHNMLTLGLLILASSFFFTMFSVYGTRASSVGFASLLIMVLQMSDVMPLHKVFTESILILSGGIWYMVIALLINRFTPNKAAKRSLGDCLHETARYLLIKSEMYNSGSDLEEEYRKLLNQQAIVNEKQNAARELLFKNRELLKESTHTGRLLVLTFVDIVDLFEHIMASWYDYSSLRKKYASTGILEEFSITLKSLAAEIDNIGEAIHAGSSYHKEFDLIHELDKIKKNIDNLQSAGSTIMLKKILINLRSLGEKTDDIIKYFNEDAPRKGKLRNRKEYSKFVTPQKIDGSVLKNNLTFHSSAFRHSLRMMITCGIGFIISKLIAQGHHSYWITMTIIIILKPSFSLTKKKNYDRILGTIGGGIIGLLLLYFIQDQTALFILILFFMLGTYTFKTLNYIVMVIFLTPYILILFHFLGLGALNVAGERLLDTVIGSILAFLASYFLFPQWESGYIQKYMGDVLKANIHYLLKLKEIMIRKGISSLEYNLARKEIFVTTANLSNVFNRMLSEPKSKQPHRKEIYEFVVLNHVLSSNIASLTTSAYNEEKPISKYFLAGLNNSLSILENSMKYFDKYYAPENKNYCVTEPVGSGIKPPDSQMKEQFDFIYKISNDISKISRNVLP